MAKKYGKTYQEVFEVEEEPKMGFFQKLGVFVALAVICMIIGAFSALWGWIIFAVGALIVWNM